MTIISSCAVRLSATTPRGGGQGYLREFVETMRASSLPDVYFPAAAAGYPLPSFTQAKYCVIGEIVIYIRMKRRKKG